MTGGRRASIGSTHMSGVPLESMASETWVEVEQALSKTTNLQRFYKIIAVVNLMK